MENNNYTTNKLIFIFNSINKKSKTMKRYLSLATMLLVAAAAQAGILRVNNNPGVTGVYTSAQAAHNAANPGDIIHLEPSNNHYGDVTCTKPLTWVSVGYFLPQNPGLQFAPVSGRLRNVNANSGSGGSVFTVACENFSVNTSNITLERCFLSGGFGTNNPSYANVVIKQSYIYYQATLNGNQVVFSNNVCAYAEVTDGNASAVITNNVLTQNNGATNVWNSIFQNNIIRGTGFTYSFFSPVEVSYNMTAGPGGIPAGNNNQFSVNMSNVFVNPGEAPQRSDKDFVLKAGSPAIGAGIGGIDMGGFGGSNPLVLGMQPAIPAITALSVPGANNTSTIQATFSAKSNQ